MRRSTAVKRAGCALIAVILAVAGFGITSCGESPTAPVNPGDLPLDANGKTPICHYQQDMGTWTLTLLSLRAALEHLAIHDDGVPGGLTVITNTRLDNECKRVDLASVAAS